MLALRRSSAPPARSALRSGRCRRSAIATASSTPPTLSQRIVNSSPPKRATVSSGRTTLLQAVGHLAQDVVPGRVTE